MCNQWLLSDSKLFHLRFPDFTSEDHLEQFSGPIKKGKAGRDYQALTEQALKAELAEDGKRT